MAETLGDRATLAGIIPALSVSSSSRRLRPVFRVTVAGWIWLAVAACLWGVGLYKGINLVTLLATCMGIIWIVHVPVAGRRLRRLSCQFKVDKPIFANTSFAVHINLMNRHRRPQVAIRLDSQGRHHFLGWWLHRLPGKKSVEFHQKLTLPQRGWYSWGPLRVSCGHPFGLAERRIKIGPVEPAIVLPQLGVVHRGRLRRYLTQIVPDIGRSRPRPCRLPAAQTEFHGLRVFRPDDSPRWIHWRTSARCAELMVREFEEVPTENLVLVLEPWTPAGMDRQNALEGAVSLAATICWEWCRQKGDRFILAVAGHAPVVLDGITSDRFAMKMLQCLALVNGEPDCDVTRLLEQLQATGMPAASILLVSTHPSSLGKPLAERFRRPVVCLDVSIHQGYDFFERAPAHAP